MLTREQKYETNKRIQELRQNPPHPTKEHVDGAKKMLKEVDAFEAKKEKDVLKELTHCSNEAATDVIKYVVKEAKTVIFSRRENTEKICCECGKKATKRYCFSDWCFFCFIKVNIKYWIQNLRRKIEKANKHIGEMNKFCSCPICRTINIIKYMKGAEYVN